MLRLAALFCLIAATAHGQDLRESLIGTWSGKGQVQIRPTSTAKATSCKASFAEVSGFWLGGQVSCGKGRRNDTIGLRFGNPDGRGQMIVDVLDDDGDAMVSLRGQLSEERLTLYHPELLEFSGTEYQPVLLFSVNGFNQFQMYQLGVPTRSDAQRYMMSDLLFNRAR